MHTWKQLVDTGSGVTAALKAASALACRCEGRHAGCNKAGLVTTAATLRSFHHGCINKTGLKAGQRTPPRMVVTIRREKHVGHHCFPSHRWSGECTNITHIWPYCTVQGRKKGDTQSGLSVAMQQCVSGCSDSVVTILCTY